MAHQYSSAAILGASNNLACKSEGVSEFGLCLCGYYNILLTGRAVAICSGAVQVANTYSMLPLSRFTASYYPRVRRFNTFQTVIAQIKI
jgi:hypothetical protein